MNKTIEQIFGQYDLILEAFNEQLKNDILPISGSLFDDFSETHNKMKHCVIRDNLNIDIPENDFHKFELGGSSLKPQIILKRTMTEIDGVFKPILTLKIQLKDQRTPELYVNHISVANAHILIIDKISTSLSILSNSSFSFDLRSSNATFQFIFDNKNRTRAEKKNDFSYIKCPELKPFLEKYKSLFQLYKLEEEAVTEVLLTDKPFNKEQSELFKLLYDFDTFDTKKLSLNLLSEHKVKSVITNKI